MEKIIVLAQEIQKRMKDFRIFPSKKVKAL